MCVSTKPSSPANRQSSTDIARCEISGREGHYGICVKKIACLSVKNLSASHLKDFRLNTRFLANFP
jgi:hypothetical protein